MFIVESLEGFEVDESDHLPDAAGARATPGVERH